MFQYVLHPYSMQADKCSLEEYDEATVKELQCSTEGATLFALMNILTAMLQQMGLRVSKEKIFESLGFCPCTTPLLHPS